MTLHCLVDDNSLTNLMPGTAKSVLMSTYTVNIGLIYAGALKPRTSAQTTRWKSLWKDQSAEPSAAGWVKRSDRPCGLNLD